VPPFPTHDDLRRLRAIYLEEREAAGRPPEIEFPVRRELFIAPTAKEAVDRIGAAARGRMETYLSWGMREGSDVGGGFASDDVEALSSRFVLGPPEACAAQLAALAE